jgi:hypothetical protein
MRKGGIVGWLLQSLGVFLCVFHAVAAVGQTQTPPATPEQGAPARPEAPRYFQPPPMPDFMKRRPERPLTQEEMQKQADEAAAGVRPPIAPAPDSADSPAGKNQGELLKKENRP